MLSLFQASNSNIVQTSSHSYCLSLKYSETKSTASSKTGRPSWSPNEYRLRRSSAILANCSAVQSYPQTQVAVLVQGSQIKAGELTLLHIPATNGTSTKKMNVSLQTRGFFPRLFFRDEVISQNQFYHYQVANLSISS